MIRKIKAFGVIKFFAQLNNHIIGCPTANFYISLEPSGTTVVTDRRTFNINAIRIISFRNKSAAKRIATSALAINRSI